MAIPKDSSYPRVLAAVETEENARIAATKRLNLPNFILIKPDFNPNESKEVNDFYMHKFNVSLIKLEEGIDYKSLPSCGDDYIAVEINGAEYHWKKGWAI
jgi:hypothetical protein